MTTVEVLRKARELIAAPGSWTQETYARTEDGSEVEPFDGRACERCAAGAVYGALGGYREAEAILPFVALERAMSDIGDEPDIVEFNDAFGRTQAEVLAAFDSAIAAEEAKAVTP